VQWARSHCTKSALSAAHAQCAPSATIHSSPLLELGPLPIGPCPSIRRAFTWRHSKGRAPAASSEQRAPSNTNSSEPPKRPAECSREGPSFVRAPYGRLPLATHLLCQLAALARLPHTLSPAELVRRARQLSSSLEQARPPASSPTSWPRATVCLSRPTPGRQSCPPQRGAPLGQFRAPLWPPKLTSC